MVPIRFTMRTINGMRRWFLITAVFFVTFSVALGEIPCIYKDSIVDCSDRNLSSFPKLESKNINTLNLSGNNLAEIPSELTAFPLIELDLSRNERINSTKINFISHTLTILDLPSCNIEEVDGTLLKNLLALEVLNLANNKIYDIPGTLTSTSLKVLHLENNWIRYINAGAFSQLTQLSSLILNNNIGLNFISFEFLPKVTFLEMANCSLEDASFGRLPSLEWLYIPHNNITAIVGETFKYPALTNLNISYNAIRTIDNIAFQNVPLLLTLDLSHNQLEYVDHESIKNIKELKYLIITHNKLVTTDFFYSDSLEYLDLSYCEISNIDNLKLEVQLPQLKRLHLSNNKISRLPNNNLRSINLTLLDLGYNDLSSLPYMAFHNLKNLTFLLLNDNKLTQVSQTLFPLAPEIDLVANPWNCDCNAILILKHWLIKQNRTNYYDQLLCKTPRRYEGLCWSCACDRKEHSGTRLLYSFGFITILIVIIAVAAYILNYLRKYRMLRDDEESTTDNINLTDRNDRNDVIIVRPLDDPPLYSDVVIEPVQRCSTIDTPNPPSTSPSKKPKTPQGSGYSPLKSHDEEPGTSEAGFEETGL